MDKQREVYPHNGMLLSNKKEELSANTITRMHFKIITLGEISRTRENADAQILTTQNSLWKTDFE